MLVNVVYFLRDIFFPGQEIRRSGQTDEEKVVDLSRSLAAPLPAAGSILLQYATYCSNHIY